MSRNRTIRSTGWLCLLKTESGGSLVEYSIVFIVLMTMLLAIADFSRAVYAYHFVSNVARDAARYASVRGSTCAADSSCTAANSASGVAGPYTLATAKTDIQDFVKRVPKGIDSTKLTINPSWSSCSPAFNSPGCTVVVQVSYVFSYFSPLVSKNSLTFSSTSQEIITH